MTSSYAYHSGRPGHFAAYAGLINTLSSGRIRGIDRFAMTGFLLAPTYVVIEGDGPMLLLAVPGLLRSALGRRTIFLSIRTELFVESTVKGKLRLWLARAIASIPNMELISIHKGNTSIEQRVPATFINDLQYWDLKYLEIQPERPSELQPRFPNLQLPILLVAGGLNEKRCAEELIRALPDLSTRYEVIIAGRSTHNKSIKELNLASVVVLDRYVNDAELLYLLISSHLIYAFYHQEVCRPSGFFGRAHQLAKHVVIRRGGHLDRLFGAYSGCIKVSELSELMAYAGRVYTERITPPNQTTFDSSATLCELVNGSGHDESRRH